MFPIMLTTLCKVASLYGKKIFAWTGAGGRRGKENKKQTARGFIFFPLSLPVALNLLFAIFVLIFALLKHRH